jgi:ubiquinone/menaquinone biosynthesis C-methylase UbiE
MSSLSTRLQTIRSIYDRRAPTYDSETDFHPAQAQDYLRWFSTSLTPGSKILDLACGTGGLTIPFAQTSGPTPPS